MSRGQAVCSVDVHSSGNLGCHREWGFESRRCDCNRWCPQAICATTFCGNNPASGRWGRGVFGGLDGIAACASAGGTEVQHGGLGAEQETNYNVSKRPALPDRLINLLDNSNICAIFWGVVE